jgi:uncharacterized protein (TIGR03435 family)
MSGGPGTPISDRIDYQSVTLGQVATRAFDLRFYQVSGPLWFDTEHYDISAVLPPGTDENSFRQMLQNLLVERFNMRYHPEAREMPIYVLSVARRDPNLRPWNPEADKLLTPEELRTTDRKVTIDSDGFPLLPKGREFVAINRHARLNCEKENLSNLAEMLSGQVGRPVIDETGLKGDYVFALSWIQTLGPTPLGASPEIPPGPDVFEALLKQLGLRLESKKGPIDMLVVDHASKIPTPN